MKTSFKIITTCYNAEKWIEHCVNSVIHQSYENWKMFITNDCSEDKTESLLNSLSKHPKINVLNNQKRILKISSFFRAIKLSNPEDEDILVFLDGDDWLPDKNVLTHLSSVYDDEPVWITWGSYIDDPGNPKVFGDYIRTKECSKFAYPAPKNWGVRHSWRYSHLKTFKYFLWKNIKDDAFRQKENDEIFTQTDDLAFMYPMLEMSGPEHSQFIHRLMYVRNTFNNLTNATAQTITKEKNNSQEIRARQPYCLKIKHQLIVQK